MTRCQQCLNGESRAEYGLSIIKSLSKALTDEYGKGFTKTNLYSFYLFYKTFPKIFHAASGKSVPLLSWTHYRTLLQVKDDKARAWYTKEAMEQTWAVRTLQRNIDSQYYYRLLSSQDTRYICLPKKNYEQKSMRKRQSSIYRERKNVQRMIENRF